jgi:hypothetical protein
LLVKDPAAYAAAKKSPHSKPGSAITRTSASGSSRLQPQTAAFIQSFPGISSEAEKLVIGGTVEPSDTQMAAGPTQILEMVNSTLNVYDKSGNGVFGITPLDAFFHFSGWSTTYFGGESFVATDPRVLYDASTARWYASVLGFNRTTFDSFVVLAISPTSTVDLNKVWNLYLVGGGNGQICDQPKLGYSADKFVIGCSLFNSSSVFQGATVIVAAKSQGLAGASMIVGSTAPDTSLFGLVPAQNLGPGATAYIAFNQNPLPAAAGLITVTGNPANGLNTVSVSATASVPMNATNVPPAAPQPGSSITIDTSDDRFNSAVVQGGALYTSGGEACKPSGDTVARACLRLVVINLTGPTLIQGATAGLVGAYLINPTLTVNSSGDIVVGYSTSSATSFPDFEVTIQPVGDPNIYVGGGILVTGTGPYIGNVTPPTSARWGDYGAAAVDPAISAYVWVAGEFSDGPPNGASGVQWGTQIGELSSHFPDCSVNSFTQSPSSPSAPGTSITLTAAATCVSGVTTETPEYQFWIKPPSGSLAMVQGYSPTATYNWSGHVTLGTYTLEVLVRGSTETTKPWDTYSITQYVITATPCTTPTLAANPSSSPQIAGTPVMLTATTTCGTTPLYQFWVQTPDLVLHKVQDYSAANTYNWNSLNTQIGSYLLYVLVKNTGSLGSYDAYKTLPYSMQLCNTPTLSTGAATSPYASGSGPITLTATGTCAGTTEYQFYYFDTAWHLIQAYSATSTASWKADYRAGNYTLLVESRPVGSTAGFITYITKAFILSGCSLTSLGADKTSPQVAGTIVTWTATAGTCSGSPQFQFWVQAPSGVWTKVQSYGAPNTFTWASPTTAGTYGIQVWVRNTGANDDLYDNYLSATYSLTLCSTPTLNTGAATTPYISGSGAITLTAPTGSCAGSTQYEFFYRDPSNVWHLIGSGYSASNSAGWSADFKAGNYALQVELRPGSSSANFVTYTSIPFQLTGCGVPSLTASPPISAVAGATVTWTATVSCTGTPDYQFYVQSPAGVYTLARAYGPSSTLTWSSPATKGTYHVQVWVRNAGATHDSFDNYLTAAYTLT